jgi:sterol desaturase/sphingolipid hydroxylase (fatty acid hydroxylase superfamily)
VKDYLHKISDAFSMPFQAVFGNGIDVFGEKRIYWIYLISSLLLSFYVYFKDKRSEKLSDYLFNKKVWFSKSAWIDYGFIFFNSIVKVFLLSAILNWGKYLAFYTEDVLVSFFGYSDFELNVLLASGLFLVIFTLVEDFFSFAIHGLFHYLPFLWHFHKVHHSAQVLNPITQYRIHPVELFFNNLVYLLAYGLVYGFFSWLFFNQKNEITTINVNIFSVLFFVWGANLRHSHIKLTYFDWLENIFISPFQHQIHHSDNQKHFNKNLGSKLAVWDKLFGTLVKSKEVSKIKFGIGTENKDFDTFLKNLWMPFVKLIKK